MWAENERYSVTCDDMGNIIIRDKEKDREEVIPSLFGEDFSYRYIQWNVADAVYLTPDSRYIIATYGIGHVYLIDPAHKRVIRKIILFEEVCYEDTSYQSIYTGSYYNEVTRVDFSSTGRYAAIRVRGDFDPSNPSQDGSTPLYFRTVFLLDLTTLEICFRESFEDVEERNDNRNIASIAFSPRDRYFAVGAPGNRIKLFSLEDYSCVGNCGTLGWVPDPCGVKHRQLVCFLTEDALIYADVKHNIRRIARRGQDWRETGVLFTDPTRDTIYSYIEDMEVDRERGTVSCHIAGGRMGGRVEREERIYKIPVANWGESY